MVWTSSLLIEWWILWFPSSYEALSGMWFLLRFALVPPAAPQHCATQRGGWSYSSFSGQILHLESQWLTASLVVINEKYVSVAINEWLVPLFFLLVIWVLWAAQRVCVQSPARSRAPEGKSSTSEELSLLEKGFDEPCRSWPGQPVGTALSSLWIMFEHGHSHISLVGLGSCFGSSWQHRHEGKAECRVLREWRCCVELWLLSWADLQGQALCFWACTHPVLTQTLHVDLENAVAAEHVLHSHSLVTEGSTN